MFESQFIGAGRTIGEFGPPYKAEEIFEVRVVEDIYAAFSIVFILQNIVIT